MKNNNNEELTPELELVVEYLETNPDEDYGLTGEKIRNRAELVTNVERPDWVTFEIDRHHQALGPICKNGDAAAWITARYRYAFDPKKKKLLELGTIGKASLDCEIEGLAIIETEGYDFSYERHLDGRIVCEESCTNTHSEVGSKEDADAFGRSIVRDWTFDGLFVESYGIDLGDQVAQAVDELHKRCADLLGEAASQAWEDAQEDWSE